jgi:hypothetical protein
MDRRSFVMRSGMLAAGSAFGWSMGGCSAEFNLNIPCLSTVPAPAQVAGMTYVKASEIGCALDCSLENGRNKHTGGKATDDAPKINQAMAGASASNPMTLIIDGNALISGLFLPAGGYWNIAGLGCGTGFFVKTGTNNDGIHNGGPTANAPSDPGPPAPKRGSSVSLRNFTLNGNQGHGSDGDSTTGATQGIWSDAGNLWYFGINLMNLDNIVLENVVVVNTPAYHVRLSNVGNVTVTGCVLQSKGNSTDGLHFDGPANDISIANCQFTTGDDAIALNCPEGYKGSISRVTVTNCTFNSWTLMRLDTIQANGSPDVFNIDTVSVSNCSGTLAQAAFLIGQGTGSLPNSVTGLTISDCNLTAPTVLEVGANFGIVTLKNITLTPAKSYEAPGFALLRTSPLFAGYVFIGSSLLVENCTINRKGDFAVAAVILENGSTLTSLDLNGFSVKDAGSYTSSPELIDVLLGSLGQLTIDTLDPTHIKAPATQDGFSSIGIVAGAGVLATAWEFPDAVMANGVPYISASTHAPAIKVNGVVEPYSG